MENLKGLTDYDEVSESVITFEEDNNVNNANSLSVDADININENDNENKAESITTKEDEEDIIADNNKNLKDIFLSKLSHKKENKESDVEKKVSSANKIVVGIVIFLTMVLVSYNFTNKNKAAISTNNTGLSMNDNLINKSLTKENGQDTSLIIDEKENKDKDELSLEIEEALKAYKNDTVNMLDAYIDTKVNRITLINTVKDNKEKKYNLYEVLKESEKVFDDINKYEDLQQAIIKDIAMDEEILKAFDGKLDIRVLNEIVDKYNN